MCASARGTIGPNLEGLLSAEAYSKFMSDYGNLPYSTLLTYVAS